MPWIKVYSVDEATGFLEKQYDAAIKRAGRVWGIVSIMSQNPRVLNESMDLYGAALPSAVDSAKCWPPSYLLKTAVFSDCAPMRTTSGLRSQTLESKTKMRQIASSITLLPIGGKQVSTQPTPLYVPMPSNLPMCLPLCLKVTS